MEDIQIEVNQRISVQVNDTILELSGEEAEKLYNLLGNVLNKSTVTPYVPYKQPEWEPIYPRWEPVITC